MNDKQLLQMLEVLGKNSRKSKSLAASDSVKADRDTRCAKTLRNIIESSGTSTRSLAASAAPSPNHNANRVKTLYDFVITNHLR